MAASYQSAVRRVQEGYFFSSYIKTLFPSRLQSKALCMQMDQTRWNQWLGFGSIEDNFYYYFIFPSSLLFPFVMQFYSRLVPLHLMFSCKHSPPPFAEQYSLMLAGAEICVITGMQGNIWAVGNVLEDDEGRFLGCICCRHVEEVESWAELIWSNNGKELIHVLWQQLWLTCCCWRLLESIAELGIWGSTASHDVSLLGSIFCIFSCGELDTAFAPQWLQRPKRHCFSPGAGKILCSWKKKIEEKEYDIISPNRGCSGWGVQEPEARRR